MDAESLWSGKDKIMFWQLRERVELCNEYKQRFALSKYKTKIIWNTIAWLYRKWFDYALFDSLEYDKNNYICTSRS